MQKSSFKISKMDCPSEENLIRMKLAENAGIKNLEFDIPNRILTVYHTTEVIKIEATLQNLNLGTTHIKSEESDQKDFENNNNQGQLLWSVLLINFVFFIVEMTTGLVSKSMGLVADSLDMLADSIVYGLSLFAVAGTVLQKKKVATIAGCFQILLALFGFIEVVRRFTNSEEIPDFSTMILVSALALIANAFCLFLLQKSTGKNEAHLRASMIFTSNDIVINLGVILAGVMVSWLNSNLPDLIIGAIVFAIVIRGAFRILQLGK